ncbi:hypothetical protein KAR91_14560 [Candidatus Pacearchaeota archaeon]|nr:hypothetical protein [Candidatus Pacearchaeota archaeon]
MIDAKTRIEAGTEIRGWPFGTKCATASDQDLCMCDVVKLGGCGALMAHGRVCIEEKNKCPIKNHNNNMDERSKWVKQILDKDI